MYFTGKHPTYGGLKSKQCGLRSDSYGLRMHLAGGTCLEHVRLWVPSPALYRVRVGGVWRREEKGELAVWQGALHPHLCVLLVIMTGNLKTHLLNFPVLRIQRSHLLQ